MNKANLKSYAPEARKDFIAAVTSRANLLGLSDKAGQLEVAPAQTQGDVTLIAGQAWPAKVATQRDQLITRMRREGFAHTCEAVAYTWFNRFAALRYMELHDYLGHGHRALSSAEGTLPDILTHAADLAQSGADSGLPGLNANLVLEMKLAGNRDGELYRMLLVAQCNALSNAMPFLFERIDDDTELLLPDNLLRTDSIVAKLVAGVPEEDWQEIEVIGWLYQFYISEKKDQVIGKVVKSEDIPAATQLFTPNWIVQYLVQNSVGRLWLMANPASTLASQWPYYIQPAEQTPEVQAQLDALIQTRMNEDGGSINPETITVLDPACGSGHILVVAYDVLKAIYLERGYRVRDIPRLILEKNLYGLDIDDRAAQMAGFALLMKARADDRRLFTATDDAGNLQPPKLNVLSLQESKGLNVDELATHLAPHQVQRATIAALVEAFEHAKTFGSLIQIPYALKTHLAVLPQLLAAVKQSGDLYAIAAADDLLPIVEQAQVLAMQFDAAVANPPYMGTKGMDVLLKEYGRAIYPNSNADVFSMFIERCQRFGRKSAELGFVTPYVWMFISAYYGIRKNILEHCTVNSLVQLEYNAFEPACVPVCCFALGNYHSSDNVGSFIRLAEFKGHENQAPKTLQAINDRDCGWFHYANTNDFAKIPGSPLAYWIPKSTFESFDQTRVGQVASVSEGVKTGDNARFLRLWHEVSVGRSSLLGDLNGKWRPHHKGGDYRRWYGNLDFVINWEKDGQEIKSSENSGLQGRENYFSAGVTWSKLSSTYLGVRLLPEGVLFDSGSPTAFPTESNQLMALLGLMSSTSASYLCKMLNPTLNFQVGNIAALPFPLNAILRDQKAITDRVSKCVDISKRDWDDYETSWDFKIHPTITRTSPSKKLGDAYQIFEKNKYLDIGEIKLLEVDNNIYFAGELGMSDVMSPVMADEHITLRPPNREKDCQRLISYAIGCMMGRYSLDEPGLIYAHAGNVGFDASRYTRFAADADGILPITDEHWFDDDAPARVRDFLQVVWGPDTLAENMAWLAESLGGKASETPEETIRRYMADKFFKDHLQTYKKRPIYWLFSSGKQGAFQALVYLHRYNEGTLARLRAQYVVPLTSKMQSRIDMLQKDALAASSTAARNKLNKDVEKLKKKHAELLAYDEQLRHYADMRINLDLDDGVKVNYGRFGDLLEGVKMVTGGAGDE